jgi:hypothetical protein
MKQRIFNREKEGVGVAKYKKCKTTSCTQKIYIKIEKGKY